MLGQVFDRPVLHAVFINWRPGFRITEAFECQTAVHCARPVIVRVLINAPAYASFLQNIGNCVPFECIAPISIAGIGHLSLYPAAQIHRLGVGIRTIDAGRPFFRVKVRSGPENDPVGIGTCGDGTMIGIGDRERFGQCILERNLLTRVIGH
ncbi:hypothetical protein D3C87_1651270 [compost metagenome]